MNEVPTYTQFYGFQKMFSPEYFYRPIIIKAVTHSASLDQIILMALMRWEQNNIKHELN